MVLWCRVRQLVLGLLTMLYNVARLVPEARDPMREGGAVATLHGYRAITEDEFVSCRALVVMVTTLAFSVLLVTLFSFS